MLNKNIDEVSSDLILNISQIVDFFDAKLAIINRVGLIVDYADELPDKQEFDSKIIFLKLACPVIQEF